MYVPFSCVPMFLSLPLLPSFEARLALRKPDWTAVKLKTPGEEK